MEIARRLVPIAGVNEVVPVGDLVVDRAAGVTIGDAAIHAARRLAAGRFLGQGNDEFAPMADAIGSRLVFAVLPFDLEKAGDLSHLVVLPSSCQ